MTGPAAPEQALGADAPPGPVSGYTIVLPPGWHHIPVRDGSGEAIRKAVDAAARSAQGNVPRDQLTAFRIEQTRRLAGLAAEARQRSGTDLYVPAGLVHGIPVPASFLVSELTLEAGAGADPGLLISGLAGEPGSRQVTVAGAAGVRTERTAGPDPEQRIEYASRRVDYVLAVPDDPSRYLAVAFSTFGGGNPDDALARLLVELFDAMMATWRWSRA